MAVILLHWKRFSNWNTHDHAQDMVKTSGRGMDSSPAFLPSILSRKLASELGYYLEAVWAGVIQPHVNEKWERSSRIGSMIQQVDIASMSFGLGRR